MQARELQAMNRPTSRSGYDDDDEMEDTSGFKAEDFEVPKTKEDMRGEEEEIKELERKKKGLEERVTGMEKDLGGLMR